MKNELRWISVDSGLPEEKQAVIAFDNNQDGKNNLIRFEVAVMLNMPDGLEPIWWCSHLKDVTHWMPLPQPPEVK